MFNYLRFVQSNWPLLCFGFLAVFLGNFGQSFFISWYGASIQADLQLNAALYGSIYSIATVLSGSVVMFAGAMIDKVPLIRFTLCVSLGLFVACLSMSFVQNAYMLFVSFFLLRLFGQSLLPHTGVTTMARRFDDNRGKAISLATSGIPLGEIILPILAVTAIAIIGWRSSWLVVAALVPIFFVPCFILLLKKADKKNREPHSIENKKSAQEKAGITRMSLIRDIRFWCVIPALLSAPFLITGVLIHQNFVILEKAWSVEWFAVCFVVYGVVHWFSSLTAGILVDRYSAVKFLPFYLLPMIASLLLLGLVEGSWVAWGSLSLLAMSVGCCGTVGSSMWAEVYGSKNIGVIRSLTTTMSVWSTSLAPILIGVFIDLEVSLRAMCLAFSGTLVLFSLLSACSYKRA